MGARVATYIVWAMLAAACASAPAPSPGSGTPGERWLPEWSAHTWVPPAIAERPILPFCGVERAGRHRPPADDVRQCVWAAFGHHQPAEFALIRVTFQGDPVAIISRVLPDGSAEMFEDATQDELNAGRYFHRRCDGLVQRPAPRLFALAGCDPATIVGVGFELDCGNRPLAACNRDVGGLAATVRERLPGQTIESVAALDAGDWAIRFTDGTSLEADAALAP
jgi:hypothetical protein